jgi:hypothetical protein
VKCAFLLAKYALRSKNGCLGEQKNTIMILLQKLENHRISVIKTFIPVFYA